MEPIRRAETARAIFFMVFPVGDKPNFCREITQNYTGKL
jgi:hypothetical protein